MKRSPVLPMGTTLVGGSGTQGVGVGEVKRLAEGRVLTLPNHELALRGLRLLPVFSCHIRGTHLVFTFEFNKINCGKKTSPSYKCINHKLTILFSCGVLCIGNDP